MNKLLRDPKFTKVLDELSNKLKKFCKRVAKRCPDKSYEWKDFFSIAVLSIWERYTKDKKVRPNKQYLNCGEWAVYGELDKINAQKRTLNRTALELYSNE